MITDTLGLALAVLVTAASVHDSAGGKQLLTELAATHPSVSKVWADGGYSASVLQHGAGAGIDIEVVQRPRVKGFQPSPKRWVIERTFGWLMQHRRLVRDYETSSGVCRRPRRSWMPLVVGVRHRLGRRACARCTAVWCQCCLWCRHPR
ncbi:transposase [Streptomyces inhibens]|uniref:transposase n=1 Tax=Streptomyces inhibens TaxID=2293571 RepID=UPI00402A6A8B